MGRLARLFGGVPEFVRLRFAFAGLRLLRFALGLGLLRFALGLGLLRFALGLGLLRFALGLGLLAWLRFAFALALVWLPMGFLKLLGRLGCPSFQNSGCFLCCRIRA